MRQRFSNFKECLLSLKMDLYLEKLLSTSQDVAAAYLNDANWIVVRGNSCKLIVVFPFTVSPVLHISSYPGFFYITLFILMKVIHTQECTTTPVHGTNYRCTEVMAKRETLTQLYTVSRSQLGTSPRCLQAAQCKVATFHIIRKKKRLFICRNMPQNTKMIEI